MPRVGEAWYDVTARDEKLLASLKNSEAKLRSSGQVGEQSFGAAARAIDNTGTAAGRATVPVGRMSGFFGRFADRSAESGLVRTTRAFNGLERGAFAVEDRLPRVHGMLGKLGGAAASAGGGLGRLLTPISMLVPGLGMLGGGGGALAAVAGLAALGGIMAKGVKAASDLNETTTKTAVVFGASASVIEKFGDTSAAAMGISKNAAMAAAATFGNLFVALKLPTEAIAPMSTALVKLAGDLASFNNVSPEEALDALKSGLVGETEPLRRFGVNLNEATIAQKALELGLISSIKQGVTPSIKAQASYALILDQTKTAQGDFARTASGLANAQRIAAAKVEDAFAKMGQVLLPLAAKVVPMLADAFSALIGGIGAGIKAVSDFYEANRGLFDILGSVAGLIGGVLVTAFQILANIIKTAFEVVSNVIGAIFGVIRGVVGGIIGIIRNVVDVISQIPGPFQEAAKGLRGTLQGMQNDVESWGSSTVATVGTVPDRVAGSIEEGKPVVAAAAKDALGDPLPAAVKDGAAAAKVEAKKTPHEIAQGMLDGRFNVKEALAQIKEDVKGSLSSHKEIAQIEGFLTSKALRKGLSDARPEVRAVWAAYKADAEERLFALKNGVPKIALATGQSYAEALAAKKKAAADAADVLAQAARVKLARSKQFAEDGGDSAGKAYADSIHDRGSYLHKQVERYLENAAAQMRFKSPPKEGPLRGVYGWGAKLGDVFPDALKDKGRSFRAASTDYLQGFSPARLGVSPGASGASSVRHSSSVGEISVHVHVDRLVADDAMGVRELGRSLGNEIRLSLVRQPVAFAMPPK